MEDEEVRRSDAQPREALIDLRPDRPVEVVDLVYDEHPLAPAPQGPPDDLLAVAVLVAGGGVDEVQARIHRAADRGDAGLDGDVPVGHIADAEDGGPESCASEFAARVEHVLAPTQWAGAGLLHRAACLPTRRAGCHFASFLAGGSGATRTERTGLPAEPKSPTMRIASTGEAGSSGGWIVRASSTRSPGGNFTTRGNW